MVVLPVGAVAASIMAAPRQEQAAGTSPPASVFAALDGTWTGMFVGFDQRGRELYRIEVSQTYQTVDETTQRVTTRDTMKDGTVVTGRGVNTARRGPDGTLVLSCDVEKSNGERAAHHGRLVRGPEGDEQIIWWSEGPDRSETFRECVRREGEQVVYSINGMGRYGETFILMHGRYHKVD
jgi:hypothetical protein